MPNIDLTAQTINTAKLNDKIYLADQVSTAIQTLDDQISGVQEVLLSALYGPELSGYPEVPPVEWNDIIGKPIEYTPTAHKHTVDDIDLLSSEVVDLVEQNVETYVSAYLGDTVTLTATENEIALNSIEDNIKFTRDASLGNRLCVSMTTDTNKTSTYVLANMSDCASVNGGNVNGTWNFTSALQVNGVSSNANIRRINTQGNDYNTLTANHSHELQLGYPHHEYVAWYEYGGSFSFNMWRASNLSSNLLTINTKQIEAPYVKGTYLMNEISSQITLTQSEVKEISAFDLNFATLDETADIMSKDRIYLSSLQIHVPTYTAIADFKLRITDTINNVSSVTGNIRINANVASGQTLNCTFPFPYVLAMNGGKFKVEILSSNNQPTSISVDCSTLSTELEGNGIYEKGGSNVNKNSMIALLSTNYTYARTLNSELADIRATLATILEQLSSTN